MGKKRKQQQQQHQQAAPAKKEDVLTLQDQLGGDVLAQLKVAKQNLVAKQREKEEELLAQQAFERKQREKNKSFEELLNEYGNQGTKF